MAKDELTPMMRQFHDMKAANPDAILLFRQGDPQHLRGRDGISAIRFVEVATPKEH